MKIYLDVIFFENVFMNYIILLIVAYVLHLKAKYLNMLISSILGSLYVIAFLLNIIPVLSNIIIKILLSIIMVFIAFVPKDFKTLFKLINIFYLVTFVIGGISFAMVYLFNNNSLIIKDSFLIGFNSLKFSVFAGFLGFIILCVSFLYINEKHKLHNLLCKITITNEHNSIETLCFIDSGNTLKDPITQKNVIIVEKNIVEKITDLNNIKKFKLIPFNSIGNENGIMFGINANEVKILCNNKTQFLIKDPIIGIYNKTFNKNYHALIGLDLLQEKYKLNNYNEKQINGLFSK